MSVRPEERRTANEYDRWLAERSPSAALTRRLLRTAATYAVNTPLPEIADHVGLNAGHRVLELGCGSGAMLAALANRVPISQAPVGIDISPRMLQLGMRRGGADTVERVAAAASRLPFADRRFDLVLAAYLFRHLEDDTLFRVLLEAHRVLKPGGILLAWEYAPTSSRLLNRLHLRLLTSRVRAARLRGFGALAPYALYAGFKHVDRLRFRTPFLFPPIPRVVVMFQKAREEAAAE